MELLLVMYRLCRWGPIDEWPLAGQQVHQVFPGNAQPVSQCLPDSSGFRRTRVNYRKLPFGFTIPLPITLELKMLLQLFEGKFSVVKW